MQAPYQVRLECGSLIYVPEDDDDIIRAVGTLKTPPKGECWKMRPELGVLVERALKNKDWEELREFLRYDSGEQLHYCAVLGESMTVLHLAVLHGELDLVNQLSDDIHR